MHGIMRKSILFIMLLMLNSYALYAGEIETVEVEGRGKTVQEAEMDALRQAVVQVSGAMVDMETLIENDSLVKDQIISASSGVVEKMERIGKPSGNLIDGFTVKIKATVKKGVLVEKLLSTHIASNKVEGADLFARSATAAEKNAAGAQMLANALEGLPDNLLIARLLDQKIEKEGEITTIQFKIQVFMHQEAYYTKVMPKLREILNTIAIRKSDKVVIDSGKIIGDGNVRHEDFDLAISFDDKKEIILALNIGRNKNGDNIRWIPYILPAERYRELLMSLSKKSAFLRVACLDENNTVINESEISLNGFDNLFFPGMITRNYGKEIFSISPFLRNKDIFNKKYLGHELYTYDYYITKASINFSLDEVRRISDVKLYFIPRWINR